MGCSNSKEAALAELKSLLSQLTSQGVELEKELASLSRSHNESVGDKTSLESTHSIHAELDKELEAIESHLAKVAKMPKNSNTNDLASIKEGLVQDQNNLEKQIVDTESRIVKARLSVAKFQPSRTFTNPNISLTAENLLDDLETTEKILRNLSAENSGQEAPKSFLSIPDSISDIQKLDYDLEMLIEQVSSLKAREIEIQKLKEFISNIDESVDGFKRNEMLKEQIKVSQHRIEKLEIEKIEIKEEINRMKKLSLNQEGLNERLMALNEIIEKKKGKDEDSSKIVSNNLVMDIEETLKKAKRLTLDIKEHRHD